MRRLKEDYNDLQAPQAFHDQAYRLLRPLDAQEPAAYVFDEKTTQALARERNGQVRVVRSLGLKDGFGQVIYSLAGTVWKFCRDNAFKGFFAGGGQGFTIQGSALSQDIEQNFSYQADVKDLSLSWMINSSDDLTASVAVPGRFPEEDYIPDYMSLDHQSLDRSAKRVQRAKGRSADEDSMSARWMVISRQDDRSTTPTMTREGSPCARSSSTSSRLTHRRPLSYHRASRPSLAHARPYTSSSSAAYLRHRHSHSYSGNATSTEGQGASFASPRSPCASPTTTANTPKPHSSRRRTFNSNPDSPLSEEVQRHAARIRRREVEEDANLQRFNRQLKAMIREGKEALGTKVEVEMFDDG